MKWLSSDRVSPILVKELRQGIRSKLFIGAFLVIQLLLFLYGTTLLMSDDIGRDPASAVALFWSALVLPLLILVPAMASQGIEKEVTGKTLELLLLTRLSSYRLVLGKWASVIVQSTLLVTSALPYLMLRYFLGGIDVWRELGQLGLLVLASALIAGITMGFWATRLNKLIKWAIVFVFLWVGPYLFVVLMVSRGGGATAGMGWVAWLYLLIATLMMLALAASRIGPPAENHSTHIRILALVALGASLLIRGSDDVEILSMLFAVCILGITIVGALTETLRRVPRLYASFVGRTGLSRWLAFPFAPGWPGGVAFTVVVLALAPLMPVWLGDFRAPVFIALAGTFLLPAAILRKLFTPARQTLGVYLLTVILLSLPIYIWGAARAFDNGTLVLAVECVAGVFPPVAFFLELGEPSGYSGTAATFEGLAVIVWSLITLVRAAREEWDAVVGARATESPVPPVAAAPEGSLS